MKESAERYQVRMEKSMKVFGEVVKLGSVAEKNKLAIENGYMLPDGSSRRSDYSKKLGERLSQNEFYCYIIINYYTYKTGKPIFSYVIYKELHRKYDSQLGKNQIHAEVSAFAKGAKDKLGELAIISKKGRTGGYKSRRALIELHQGKINSGQD
jgi:hypothetical protein